MRAVCAWETGIYLHALYKKVYAAFDDFSFHFFVREFSNCNKMFAKVCKTTQVFSVESSFSALMSGDVQTTETVYNFYKNNLDYKIMSSSNTFNQLRNQVEEKISVLQYFKTKIQKSIIALK